MPILNFMKSYTLLTFLLLTYVHCLAQGNFTLSGTILNENSEPIEAATVFIDGSKQFVRTDADGKYSFSGISNGGYHLVVSMIGYGSIKQDVVIQDKSVTLNIKLIAQEQTLREVVIVGDIKRLNYLKLFKKYFLGESNNAAGCTILNSEVLNFTMNGKILSASSDDFLQIQNSVLGYKIKYLLKDFQYNSYLETTQYQGQCIFEEMEGSNAEKEEWRRSRRAAYFGSLMHYLRALYTGSTQSEGFLTYKVLNERLPIDIDIKPVSGTRLQQKIADNLTKVKYKRRLYTVYNKKLAAQNYTFPKEARIIRDLDEYGSIFKTDAMIDSKGNYVNYKELLIQGFWGRKRIGDQLPYEYIPD